jgi:hypothetical protein
MRRLVGKGGQPHERRMQDHIAETLARVGELLRGDKLRPYFSIRDGLGHISVIRFPE